MEPEFWHDAWREGRLGWHQAHPHVFLERHHAWLGAPGRVLVPLSGKSHDLLFLAARGHHVVGVELSERGARDFFAEHALTPTERDVGAFKVLTVGTLSVWVGDFFAFDAAALDGPLTALYDRAAVVALPEDMRRRYAAHVRAMMPADARGLVITFDYPQELMSGPPFAVSAAHLRELYQGLALEEIDSAMGDGPRIRASSVPAVERCFTLRF